MYTEVEVFVSGLGEDKVTNNPPNTLFLALLSRKEKPKTFQTRLLPCT